MNDARPSTLRERRFALGVSYQHPRAFWVGVTAVTGGTLVQLPAYFRAKNHHYHLVGTHLTTTMLLGMAVIVVGIVLTMYGLFPKWSDATQGAVTRIKVRALDDAPMTKAHIGLILVMAVAVTIDVMKPTTLAFVAPGAAAEYGLRSALHPHAAGLPVALYPLSGIAGTVLGAFVWGWLGDRLGRRATLLVAAVVFIATSACGTMPTYSLNLVTCLIMGIAVGGMLPIIFSLVSENIPARHRGWVIVLIGGDVAGAYIVISWVASTFAAPNRYGWRMLWLIGIPVSFLLVVVNRWMPESPRFLLRAGREAEAQAIMQRYGAAIVPAEPDEVQDHVHGHYGELFRSPFTALTLVVVLLALGIGAVQFGFQQWIPSNLQKLGYSEVNASKILRDSALIGFPLNFPVALLYGFWSSRKTILIMAGLSVSALAGFVLAGPSLAHNHTLLHVLLIVPIWGISSLTAVTAAYASEIYPTRVRAQGSGLTAGIAKLGGVLILAAVAAAVAAPSISVTAALGAVPLALAMVFLIAFGIETRKKRLEEITLEEFGGRALPAA